MPRQRIKKQQDLDNPRDIQLRAYSAPENTAKLPSVATYKSDLTIRQDAREARRLRLGRAISMDRIEVALQSAQQGNMQDLTDLSRETIDVDPHLAAVLQKRFGAVSTLPWEIRPASGVGIDKEKALFYAAVVREQIHMLSDFQQFLEQMAWALFDGRCAHEIHWRDVSQYQDNKFGPVRRAINTLGWIHPRRLCFGPHRELQVVDESQHIGGTFAKVGLSLDPDNLYANKLFRKFITWTPQRFGEYPEREGLAPRCLYWSFFKRFGQRERMILMELFGKPWRIIEVDEDSGAGDKDLESADEVADALGASYTARMPRGTHLKVEQPGDTAGMVHKDVIEEADSQISKLVLGQTATTDEVPAGINNPQALVMQSEQFMIRTRDAASLSGRVEYGLTDAIIAANYGEGEIDHAPHFVLRADLPPDRKTELERLQMAEKAGLEIALDEAYEVSGFRRPEEDETVIRIGQPSPHPLAPVPPPERPIIVYPANAVPPAGEQPSPPRAPDEAEPEQPEPEPETEDSEIEIGDEKEGFREGVSDEMVEAVYKYRKIELQRQQMFANAGHVCCARDHKQPDTPLGSPEEILDKGQREMWRITRKWADKFEAAVKGLERPSAIFAALNRAMEDLDLQPLGRAFERKMIHSFALGAMDSALEIGEIDTTLSTEPREEIGASRIITLDSKQTYSGLSFDKAMRILQAKNIITRAQFNNLSAALKRKAFTVAGISSEQMLAVLHDELVKQVGAGADLREFSKFMEERLRSSGMVATKLPETGVFSASHIETVFRTNALNSYNAGRYTHAKQPRVIRARPVWEMRSIGDPRSRRTHAAANNKRLLATDPFWSRCYPPMGFNCRCRVVTRPASELSNLTPGSWMNELPDRGFVSGTSNLF